MTSPAFEAFLAKLYADADFRSGFLADPQGMARTAGLNDEECGALAAIDRTGLEMAAASYARKREKKRTGIFARSLPRRRR